MLLTLSFLAFLDLFFMKIYTQKHVDRYKFTWIQRQSTRQSK